jgi:hypothetical protein
MRQKTAVPTTKVTAGALAGALSAIVVWILNAFVMAPEKQIPAEIGMMLTTVLTFLVSYLTPPSPGDAPVE